MSQSIKKKYLLFIALVVLGATDLEKGNISKSQPLDLSVYDGQGSLLIHWSIPADIYVSETSLFVKKFGEDDFELLTTMLPEESKYLDYNCDPGNRYFYKIEVIDIFGNTYFSDLITPPFGTCLVFDEGLIFNDSIQSVQDLILVHLKNELQSPYPFEYVSLVTNLFKKTITSKNNWIELFPLNKLEYIEEYIPYLDDVINNIDLVDAIQSYDKLYRNYLFLTPEEWKIKIEEEIENIRKDWEILYKEYPIAIIDYNAIAPIRILTYRKVTDDELYLDLYLFHPNQIMQNEIYLLSEEEYIDLENYKLIDSVLISIQVPKHWEYVDLMMDDIFIQTCPLVFDESVIFTIQGDIIPMQNNLNNNPIKIESTKSSIWLNEITWNPFSKSIGIELAGLLSTENQYFIKNNNSIIWEIETLNSYDSEFIDSSLALNQNIVLPTVISLQAVNDNQLTTLEYIYLDTLPFAISRVPDGYGWNYSESNTLGKTNRYTDNDFKSNFVPELFVLYQNYPNPFNGKTKISFDLFEDAMVNLYITDAKGRIHDKLISEQFITSGIYNYFWDGEGRATGIYFITLEAQINEVKTAVFSRKMIYLK